MKGETGSGAPDPDPGSGSGSGAEPEWRNPYPLPGQDWGPSKDDPSFQPPKIPGLPDAHPLPPAARPVRRKGRRLRGTFVVVMAMVVSGSFFWSLFRVDSGSTDIGGGPGTVSSPPSSPEPEPVSTVPPKVKGWTPVTSATYGLTYDVPAAWRILSSTTLRGYEGIDGGEPVAMSSTAVFREDACRDGDDEYDRGGTGFNQYVEGGVAEVAKHVANKWAAHAYHLDGAPPPAVAVGAPEPVRVGRAKAVHVRADVVLKTRRTCLSPTAVVHAVAVPGVAAGKTTVFVLLSDQGVPDALPKAEITKVLRSLRPS